MCAAGINWTSHTGDLETTPSLTRGSPVLYLSLISQLFRVYLLLGGSSQAHHLRAARLIPPLMLHCCLLASALWPVEGYRVHFICSLSVTPWDTAQPWVQQKSFTYTCTLCPVFILLPCYHVNSFCKFYCCQLWKVKDLTLSLILQFSQWKSAVVGTFPPRRWANDGN